MALPGWIETNWIAEALRQHGDLYMAVNAAHILGLALLIGAIIPLDLRLLGAWRSVPVQVVAPFLSRCAMAGLILAAMTGVMLWSVQPEAYLGNAAFRWKMFLLVAALVTAGLQHAGPGWRRVVDEGEVSASVRAFAGLSLFCWLAVLLAGRWIGFL